MENAVEKLATLVISGYAFYRASRDGAKKVIEMQKAINNKESSNLEVVGSALGAITYTGIATAAASVVSKIIVSSLDLE